MTYIETSRLILRDWLESDRVIFQRMNADPEVMRFFPKTSSQEETNHFILAIEKELKESNYGLYAVEVKATGNFIGFIGFHKASFSAGFTPCIEIGWRLCKSAWGNGYATEGAKACLVYGFENLGFEEVYSFTASINLPSENVMKKIGLQFVGEFEHPNVDNGSILKNHVLYHIKK